MKALKIILVVIVAIVAIAFVSTLFMPATQVVERSTIINAPVATVFNQVNDLKKWDNWSPWHKMDSAMEKTYSENTVGLDAWQSWKSNNKDVGEGKMTIIESVPNEKVVIGFEFKDWGNSQAVYLFEETEEGTKLTNKMDMNAGSNPLKKLVNSMMAGVLARQFDSGLKDIKAIAESAPAEPVATYKMSSITETTTNEMTYLSIKDSCSIAVLSEKLAELYGNVMAAAGRQNLQQAGAPFAIYHVWNIEDSTTVVEAGIPVNALGKSENNIKAGKMAPMNAVMVDFWGAYSESGSAHYAIDEWVKSSGKTIVGAPWEVYITDPATVNNPMEIQTQIYYPVQ